MNKVYNQIEREFIVKNQKEDRNVIGLNHLHKSWLLL